MSAKRAGRFGNRSAKQRISILAVAQEPRRAGVARRLAGLAALWTMAVGALVLAGWALDLAMLKSVGPRWVTLKANSAIGFILAGAALWTLRDKEPPSSARRFARACAATVALIGFLTLLEYLVGWQLGIDQLLFSDPANAIDTSAPGRMGPASAFNFLLLGLALWLLDDRPVARNLGQALALTVFGVGSMAAVAYLYQVKAPYQLEAFSAMAAHAALTFMMMAVGLLCARPERGLVAMLTSSTTGGLAARRLLPVALFAPPLLGWLRLAGQRSGFYETEFGVALLTLSNSLVIGIVVWWSAHSLHRTDTERARSDEAIRKSERLFHQLFESSPDAVLLVQPGGRIARVNHHATALFGYQADELTGQPIETLIPERFRAAHIYARDAYAEAPTLRPTETGLELFGLRRDGTEFAAAISLSPIETEAGAITLCVVRDISERKRTEAALKLTQFAMDHAADGAAWLRPDASYAYVNDAVCRLLGYSREELLSLKVFEINPDFTPDTWRRHWTELKQAGSLAFERRLRRKDGRIAILEISANFLAFADQEFNCSSYRDVTDRKQAEADLRDAEEQLRRAVSAGNVGLWDRNLATNTIFYSPEWKSQIGYENHEISNDFEEFRSRVHPEDFERVHQTVQAYLSGAEPTYEVEYRFRHKDGSYRHILARGAKVLGDDGTPIRLLGTHVDITERTELQARFLQAQKMDVVGRLAGGVAHDFNNLLTVINGTADLAMTDLEEGDPLRADLLQIRSAGDRAASLTRQLLAFSRRQTLASEVLNLNTVVADMQSMLQRLIGEDINLVVAPMKDLGNVMADRGQIEQVVMNLAVNARDAMPGGGRLTIETQDVEIDEAYAAEYPSVQPGPHVMLAVTDTGAGMDEPTRRRIFEPFFTTKEMGKGTGLGLSTVYGIVKQSGGGIWVYSEPDRGTTFKICLPRVEDVAHEHPPTHTATTVRGTETILLVEDEEVVRRLATRMLQSAGYTVLTASNGAKALRLLERHDGPVHLLLTDVVMPGMSGRDLAGRLAEIRPGIKVLYTSGYTNDANLRHGVVDHVVHFVGKPYSKAELTRKVREVLDSEVGLD